MNILKVDTQHVLFSGKANEIPTALLNRLYYKSYT